MATGGVFDRGDLRSISGYALLRRVADGELPHAPVYRTLGLRIVAVDVGRVAVTGTPSERYYNPIGSIHGGYVSTLLDTCMGCAIHSVLKAGQTYATVDITVKYVRPLRHDTGEVRANGSIIHAGRRIATAEGRLVDSAGKLYAHGVTTCAILPVANQTDDAEERPVRRSDLKDLGDSEPG